MTDSFGIFLSFALLPVFGLMQYLWIRAVGLKLRGFAAGVVQLCKMMRVPAPLIVFLVECIRYFGVRARIFVPDEPPKAIEMIWGPLWVFAAVWVVMAAARRAGKVAR
jgi:hypothetical protein